MRQAPLQSRAPEEQGESRQPEQPELLSRSGNAPPIFETLKTCPSFTSENSYPRQGRNSPRRSQRKSRRSVPCRCSQASLGSARGLARSRRQEPLHNSRSPYKPARRETSSFPPSQSSIRSRADSPRVFMRLAR